jgi:two-component system chemotaxis response regulator CheB
MKIERGRIHLAPPDHHLIVHDGHFRLGRGPRENLVRPAIDPLFRSAAIAYGPRSIGVILSGLLNDGADGLRAIKRCGGIALVQSPNDCEASDMPLAALAATPVDLSIEAASLGQALQRFVSEESPVSRPAVPPDIRLEVDIAAGSPLHSDRVASIASPVALSCPACGGVLSQMRDASPLRFRCQVGHGYTDQVLAQEQESSIDEAMRVALRIIEERAELVSRMGHDAAAVGRSSTAEMFAQRAAEYRGYADKLREAVFVKMAQSEPPSNDGEIVRNQVLGEPTAEEESP